MIYNRPCKHCRTIFTTNSANKKFCDKPECQRAYVSKRTEWLINCQQSRKNEKIESIRELKYKVCSGCHNREQNCYGEYSGKCLAFKDGIQSIAGTSFIEDNICQAFLDYDGRVNIDKMMRG